MCVVRNESVTLRYILAELWWPEGLPSRAPYKNRFSQDKNG